MTICTLLCIGYCDIMGKGCQISTTKLSVFHMSSAMDEWCTSYIILENTITCVAIFG